MFTRPPALGDVRPTLRLLWGISLCPTDVGFGFFGGRWPHGPLHPPVAPRVARVGRELPWPPNRILMDFPAWVLEPVDKIPKALVEGIGMTPMEVFITSSKDNLFAILRDEAQVRSVQPRLECLETLHPAGVVVTAQGENSDCTSRYFAPSYGIPEDPGTGSIHCGLVPFWGERLRKKEIYAYQMSSRGAEL